MSKNSRLRRADLIRQMNLRSGAQPAPTASPAEVTEARSVMARPAPKATPRPRFVKLNNYAVGIAAGIICTLIAIWWRHH